MLIGILGDLGSGKTLTLTYYALKTYWLYKKEIEAGDYEIYSNYHLYKLPYTYSPDLNSTLDEMRNGVLLADELQDYVDSSLSAKKRIIFLTKIIRKSRKRGLDIFYTTQYWKAVHKRIRVLTKPVCFPELNERNNTCKVTFGLPALGGRTVDFSNSIKFNAKPIYSLYDTNEEIAILE